MLKPTLALLAGASLWGIVWYPYRLLAQAGLDGLWSTLLTYGFSLLLGALVFRRHLGAVLRMPKLGWLMAFAIGWSNLAYVMGVLEGEVMRVLLLFYLAPLWTVPIAWIALGEKLDRNGAIAWALAFAGAAVMLWKPEVGIPWPQGRADWLGLAAGFLFALGNVLVRKLESMTDEAKSIAIWLGVTIAALVHLHASPMNGWNAAHLAAANGTVIAGVGAALCAMSLALQYGLSRLPANRAIVILLVELPVAAFFAWLLAGETLRVQDALGGALIVAATLCSRKLPPGQQRNTEDTVQ